MNWIEKKFNWYFEHFSNEMSIGWNVSLLIIDCFTCIASSFYFEGALASGCRQTASAPCENREKIWETAVGPKNEINPLFVQIICGYAVREMTSWSQTKLRNLHVDQFISGKIFNGVEVYEINRPLNFSGSELCNMNKKPITTPT